ncbi:phenylalanine--tRNA ligase subunit beta [Candidatus Saccharibacteria bacterium]|nr:phenylalanine--tRNA ligase subunit beta [Candidatus Saccharibacteria bacterium]
MKISLNWIKKYVDIKVPDDELIRLIGARLVEVEGVIDETSKYNNIYVAKVVSAEKIPDTHLTLCQIYVGDREVAKVEKNAEGLVQVVCGAPNVREGMLAAWIAPGAIVPASVHEDAPFIIGKRKMLGKYESNGMLAGADELDFGDDHSGIVEINPEEAKLGDSLADVFELNDSVLEIENKSLTHRPDTFGIIGFAREVAGILGEEFHLVSRLRPSGPSPRADGAKPRAAALRNAAKLDKNSSISITISDVNICSRYTAVVLEKHGEIKKKYLTWQDTILAKSGMRPVDPIVDATNYLMLLTGQPLHAFDYDKFVGVGGSNKAQINVRLAKLGEKLTLIGGKEVELNENDIVICSNDTPVALAGAMGGESTEISAETKNIIIESATFSLYNLRKTQMAHGIFTEAITRFTKGQPPYQTLEVAEECAAMLADGFEVAEISDKYPRPEKEVVVNVKVDEINTLLGTEYDEKLIVKTLENVGFEVKTKRGQLEVKAPEWRTDIKIREDVIEEIGRLLGYDNIVPTLPNHATAESNKMWAFKTWVRDTLSKFGANELLTYSFVSEKLLKKAGLDSDNSYKIVNSISPELQYVRQSIVPSLLEKAYMNQKIPFDKFALFEMNKVYRKDWGMDDEKVPTEKIHLGFVMAERKGTGAAYYKAKFYAAKLLEELQISVEFLPIKMKIAEALPFESKRAAEIWTVDGKYLGVVGEFKNSVRRNFKLAEYLAGFELDMEALMAARPEKNEVRNNFEVKDKQDITIETNDDYEKVFRKVVSEHAGAEVTPVSIYQPENGGPKKMTFHLEFR